MVDGREIQWHEVKHARPHGTAVANRGTISARSAAAGWARTAVSRCAHGDERRVLDSTHRGALARSAGALWTVPDMPSALPAMGARGTAGEHSLGLDRRPGGAR